MQLVGAAAAALNFFAARPAAAAEAARRGSARKTDASGLLASPRVGSNRAPTPTPTPTQARARRRRRRRRLIAAARFFFDATSHPSLVLLLSHECVEPHA